MARLEGISTSTSVTLTAVQDLNVTQIEDSLVTSSTYGLPSISMTASVDGICSSERASFAVLLVRNDTAFNAAETKTPGSEGVSMASEQSPPFFGYPDTPTSVYETLVPSDAYSAKRDSYYIAQWQWYFQQLDGDAWYTAVRT